MTIDINKIRNLDKNEIKRCLKLQTEEQEELFSVAREIRNQSKFANNVELRSVIEISNICVQKCKYCSMGKNGKKLFTLPKEEILSKIKMLASVGRRTFLLQSGERSNQNFIDDIAFVCKKAMEFCPDIKLILCMGNLSKEQYKQLKEAGATRYILKFETSNANLHHYCRPSDTIENRLKCINDLISLGYQTGSGNIVGLPNQTLDDLVSDLELINKLKLSMVSATKFIPNNFSEFKDTPAGNINLTLNFLALLRIIKPDCLIPSTSSLEQGSTNGQVMGLLSGCNTVTIHDGTPKEFEKNYSIYSDNRFMPEEQYCRDIIANVGMNAVPSLI